MEAAQSSFEEALNSASDALSPKSGDIIQDSPTTNILEASSSDADALDEESVSLSAESDESTELFDTIHVSTFFSFLAKCGVNLVLPFINGVMLGFGEIFAHEFAYKHHWIGARVGFCKLR